MADKTIGDLPVASELYDDSLLVVEQQKEARSIRGELIARFAKEEVQEYVQGAVDAAAAAENSAGEAKADADRAEELRQSIELDYEYIDTARSEAQASAQAAGESQEKAKDSEDAAKASQDEAAKSEQNAAGSAEQAKVSEDAAKASQEAAQTSQEEASVSESAAAAYANAAKGSETNAGESAAAAAKSAADGSEYATAAQSYTEGNTGSREGEEVDNAKYYYEQAKRVSQGLAGALLPMGTVTFSELKTQDAQVRYMYNISDDFTTDETFCEGAGHAYPAGTNVYYTADGYWDCLAGAQVVSVNGQTGAVTITPENIGALPITGGTLTGDLNVGTGINTLKVGDKVELRTDNEGGNLALYSPTKEYLCESDLYYGHIFRIYIKELASDKVYDVFRLSTNPSETYIKGTANKVSQPLTFTGGSNASYDGSQSTSVKIPSTAADIGAVAKTGDTMTGNLTMSGAERYISFASTTRGAHGAIGFFNGDGNGSGVVIGEGGRTIIGGGESAFSLRSVLTSTDSSEEMHVASDSLIYLHTNCNDITARKTVTIDRNGMITAPGGFSGNAATATKLGHTLSFSNGSTVKFDGSTNQTVSIPNKLSLLTDGVWKAGDTLTWNNYVTIGVCSSTTTVRFTIHAGKPITAAGIKITKAAATFRGTNGRYGGSTENLLSSDYTLGVNVDAQSKAAGWFCITAEKKAALANAIANTVVSVNIDITISFTASADEGLPGPEIFDDPVQDEIDMLKSRLAATDYVVIKIAEGAAAKEEYADVIAQRQEWRAEINRLEDAV